LLDSAFPHSRENHENQNTEDHQGGCRLLFARCDKCHHRLLSRHRRHGLESTGICCARRSPSAFGKIRKSQGSFGKIVWLLPLIALALAGCSYDGSYRYECQDPKVFTDRKAHPECHRPLCEASGICTEDILGIDIYKQIMDQVDAAQK